MAISDPSDQDLLVRIRNGDQQAFELLFDRYYANLVRFASAQLRSRSDADDAVQDVFVRLWRGRDRLEEGRSLRSYLLASVRNGVIDQLRRRRLEGSWYASLHGEQGRPLDEALSLADRSVGDDPAELRDLDTAIRAAIETLPERCRTAFLLCRDQGLSYAEAAEVMNVAPGTVKTQMGRALGVLRTALRPYLCMVAFLLTFPR